MPTLYVHSAHPKSFYKYDIIHDVTFPDKLWTVQLILPYTWHYHRRRKSPKIIFQNHILSLHRTFCSLLPTIFTYSPSSLANTTSRERKKAKKNKEIYLVGSLSRFLRKFLCVIVIVSTSIMEAKCDNYSMINFEETELRLGLPGGKGNDGENTKNNGKRGFSETVDLKLNISTAEEAAAEDEPEKMEKSTVAPPSTDPAKQPAKAQVVGWPPVRSFRKNIMAVQKNSSGEGDKAGSSTTTTNTATAAAFVKVSMDGAPYLRKVDLKLYKSYQELSDALGKMFSSFTIGNCGSQGSLKDFMNESKLIDLLNGSDYVPTYEDKDGDWMLVGDVPWDMFVDSCKRLRIMKGSEAIGLAPRAVEKCKNRS